MFFKPTLFVAIFFALFLVAAPAFAQIDFSEIMVDGQITPEQAEILEKLEPRYKHQTNFIEETVQKQLDERGAELMEAGPRAMREEAERLKEQAREAYRTEYPDRAETIEGFEAELRAIADGDDDQGKTTDDDESDGDKQDLATIFDDVDGEIAVYGREGRKVTRNDGYMILQDDGHAIEFCYADTGCEDRSDVDGLVSAGMGDSRLHQSEADKEVVGLRLYVKVHPDSAATASIFVVTGHTSDAFGNPFEIEDTLFESDQYEPGDTVTYELGKAK